jgi:hypothetical protein
MISRHPHGTVPESKADSGDNTTCAMGEESFQAPTMQCLRGTLSMRSTVVVKAEIRSSYGRKQLVQITRGIDYD